MIKKGLFVVALLAMLTMTVQAGDLVQPEHKGTIKIDSSTISSDANDADYMNKWPSDLKVWWPYTICYTALEICQIPVNMEIGMYAEMKDCTGKDAKKIVLKQVACSTLTADDGKARGSGDFPCYKGCADLEFKNNFIMKLGTVLYRKAVGTSTNYVIENGKWKAYYTTKYLTPGDVIPATTGNNYTKTELCVEAWSADIFYASVGTEVQVGEVAVTVKPNS